MDAMLGIIKCDLFRQIQDCALRRAVSCYFPVSRRIRLDESSLPVPPLIATYPSMDDTLMIQPLRPSTLRFCCRNCPHAYLQPKKTPFTFTSLPACKCYLVAPKY